MKAGVKFPLNLMVKQSTILGHLLPNSSALGKRIRRNLSDVSLLKYTPYIYFI